MPRIQPQVVTVDLSNILAITDYVNGAQPGKQIASVLVASMPAVAGIQMAFEAKNPFPIVAGFAMSMGECNFIDNGISIVNPAPLVGQSLVLVLIPYVDGASPTATNAG